MESTINQVKDWLKFEDNKAKLDAFMADMTNKQAITGLSVGAAVLTGNWLVIVAVVALAYGLYKQES